MLAALVLKGSKCFIVSETSAKFKWIPYNADVIYCPTVRWQAITAVSITLL